MEEEHVVAGAGVAPYTLTAPSANAKEESQASMQGDAPRVEVEQVGCVVLSHVTVCVGGPQLGDH